ncbi:hypothetical protein ABGV42_00325 [Paenibacillus pabuli]|uniref:hypothetical protein n=1 Tax=Paenibacillus pabuli TaxID=1472 RepID=UPI003241EBC7
MKKEPFVYSYNKPCLDWYQTVNVTINDGDYLYFRIERRYGPSWWLIGMSPEEKPKFRWADTDLGEIHEGDLLRFIEWAKIGNGSQIIEFKSISGDFDILGELLRLTDRT